MNQFDMSTAATRPSDLKLNNRMQILELFKSGAVYSVADIARSVGISRQTVMKAIQFFLEKDIIVSNGKANSGSMGGKRAELFTLSNHHYFLSVVICPNCLYISLFNFRCEVIGDFTCEDIVEKGIDEIMDAAIAACGQLMSAHGIDKSMVRGLCVTSSGIMERHTNTVRFNSLFPKWGRNVPIAAKLAQHFGDSVTILTENIGKVCGSAFLPDSRAKHNREAAVFSRWGGVSACLMNMGYILQGKDALIGEIGHMTLYPDDQEICACGCRGCFERQVSVERLRLLASKWAQDCPESSLAQGPLDSMTIRSMFEASVAGDPLARRLVAYAAKSFAFALRNLTLLFNPERVILQGDYAFADEHFRRTLFEELRAFHYYDEEAEENKPFVLEMDKRTIQELATVGAYTLLIDRLFSDETTYS